MLNATGFNHDCRFLEIGLTNSFAVSNYENTEAMRVIICQNVENLM